MADICYYLTLGCCDYKENTRDGTQDASEFPQTDIERYALGEKRSAVNPQVSSPIPNPGIPNTWTPNISRILVHSSWVVGTKLNVITVPVWRALQLVATDEILADAVDSGPYSA